MVKTKKKDLARQMGIVIKDLEDEVWDARILPYQHAPVALETNGQRHFASMQFSLVPNWSKTPKVKFATHNARLFSTDERTGKLVPIYEKPTWRDPFKRRHCLVPMTEFIEPIYTGELAGNMVRFHPIQNEPLFAAGIWEDWTSRETGEVIESFSVITDDPIPFVKEVGHDRTPVFLPESAFDGWLKATHQTPARLVEMLREEKAHYEWTAEIDRPLKAGWESRVKKGK